ncbi:gene transfer agent family protein [Methylocella silvestris]|nr:gene transfer agent family protein [Methylocella silvestris]
MSEEALSTAVYRTLGGRDYRFQLRLGEMRELERLCNAGIGAIWRRMAMLEFRVDDLRETIRLGLIGGGTPEPEAEAIVRFSIDARPVNDYFDLALAIIKAMFEGVRPKKPDGTDQSGVPETSAPSMSSAAPQDSAPDKSTT